jgi:hypothetical protein
MENVQADEIPGEILIAVRFVHDGGNNHEL